MPTSSPFKNRGCPLQPLAASLDKRAYVDTKPDPPPAETTVSLSETLTNQSHNSVQERKLFETTNYVRTVMKDLQREGAAGHRQTPRQMQPCERDAREFCPQRPGDALQREGAAGHRQTPRQMRPCERDARGFCPQRPGEALQREGAAGHRQTPRQMRPCERDARGFCPQRPGEAL
jgi:hypothetical protein